MISRRHAATVAGRVEEAVAREVEIEGARRWLVAFSGGPDSSALAWALATLRRRLDLEVTLAHVDHGLDEGSAERALRARALGERLGLPVMIERLSERPGGSSGESAAADHEYHPAGVSLEAWARERRYAALDALARRLGSERIATAHHADDQAETLLLRLAFGTGLFGLRGIRRRHGRIVRPLLTLRRAQLVAALDELGLEPVFDPTNEDLRRPRNRIRHRILPEWTEKRPELVDQLCALSKSAAAASRRLEEFFTDRLRMQELPGGGAGLDRRHLDNLPPIMKPLALTSLEKLADKGLPTAAAARSELFRQLDAGDRVGCDAGAGWRWHADAQSLRLVPPSKPLARFTYTVEVPGSVSIAEIGALLRISAAPAERLEVADQATKAYLRPPSTACRRVEIRNRRPGDRLRPAGRQRERRLKSLLIDQRIPRERRDHLPLVVIEDRIAWVPGVAIDDRSCAREGEPAWLVELSRLEPAGAGAAKHTGRTGDSTEDMR